MMLKTVLTLLLGLLAGILGGLFGIGGGLVMVPGMALLLGMDDKKAVGTSFATILLPVGLFGVIEYWKSGNVDLRVAVLLGIGFIAGSFGGGYLANHNFISKNAFKLFYAGFLILVAGKYIYDVVSAKPKPEVTPVASAKSADR